MMTKKIIVFDLDETIGYFTQLSVFKYAIENEIKDQEMFEENNLEEDFEIPAFLRRQKN